MKLRHVARGSGGRRRKAFFTYAGSFVVGALICLLLAPGQAYAQMGGCGGGGGAAGTGGGGNVLFKAPLELPWDLLHGNRRIKAGVSEVSIREREGKIYLVIMKDKNLGPDARVQGEELPPMPAETYVGEQGPIKKARLTYAVVPEYGGNNGGVLFTFARKKGKAVHRWEFKIDRAATGT